VIAQTAEIPAAAQPETEERCASCSLFDRDVLTVAIHLQQLKRERFAQGHVEIHFTAEGSINTNAIFDVVRTRRTG
jgi:hypothetical protein